MQIPVNSANIGNFGFSVVVDLLNRTMLFDTSVLTTYNGSGISLVQGISFSVVDQDGVILADIDWTSPQINPDISQVWTLDLTSVNFAFLYQNYKIFGSIKDQNGVVYSTLPVVKKICEPTGVTEDGYVPGLFQVEANCTDNVLTVKELTLLAYADKIPFSVTKSGSLYYPTGTISPIAFTSTPWSNNVISTGENRINCTTVARYDMADDVYVDVTYKTSQVFPVTCNNVLGDLSCCLVSLENTAKIHCNDAIGANAREQMNKVSFTLMTAVTKQINGQDASAEVAWIKKTLNCNCGANSVQQNEVTPINPIVNNIVLSGVGGTTIAAPTITGITKTYNIASKVYQVGKSDVLDLSYSITVDTATSNTVKYKIAFNTAVMAQYLLTAIGADPTLITQLNALISPATSYDLTNLNGGCIVDLSSNNYFVSFHVPNNAVLVKSVKINGTTYTAPGGLLVSSTDSILVWLNGLGKGTFQSSYNNGTSGAYINILSKGNSNTLQLATFTIASVDTVLPFEKTNLSLVAFLQAMIDYLCNISSLNIALGTQLSLCQFDYNSNVVVTSYQATQKQAEFNQGVAGAICNLIQRINVVGSVTCNLIQGLFLVNPNIALSSGDSILSIAAGVCLKASPNQIALAVISSIKNNAAVKAAFCSISCTGPSSGSYVLGTTIYNVCGATPVTLYSAVPFAIGVALYYNAALTSLVTGFLCVVPIGSSSIYNIGTSTGIVGTNTGFTCGGVVNNGVFRLSNSSGSICAAPTTTLYYSGTYGVGTALYTDAALTIHQTGYTFVQNQADGIIYNLNTSTGVVGTNTGLTCGSTATLTFSFTNAGGSFLRFNALLSQAVDANITVTRMFADGFPAVGCAGGTSNASAQSNGTNLIAAGGTGFNVAPDSTTGTWASANHYNMYNIIVNGVSHSNGDVITVGSYSVTIVIPTCS